MSFPFFLVIYLENLGRNAHFLSPNLCLSAVLLVYFQFSIPFEFLFILPLPLSFISRPTWSSFEYIEIGSRSFFDRATFGQKKGSSLFISFSKIWISWPPFSFDAHSSGVLFQGLFFLLFHRIEVVCRLISLFIFLFFFFICGIYCSPNFIGNWRAN